MPWFRRSLIAGTVVIVPLVITVAAFIWLFELIDGVMRPVYAQWLGREIPGLGLATMLLLVVIVGSLTTNVIGRKLLSRGEEYLLRLPVFRAVYGPVKQLVAAFSPGNEMGFKRVVLVDDSHRGLALGFLTKEFGIDKDDAIETHVAVYVPTNHIYFGDIHIYPGSKLLFPDMTVQEGVQVFLTGGMAMTERLRVERKKLESNDSGS
ncbi:uncharacterized protein METZ01_LOCUS258203 [marine metagenome]|uniref:DUF502 domain-containing protein n=1 Tax=marine metagenome TaxID=408172 RepID=A0A382J160_9ZZZZ